MNTQKISTFLQITLKMADTISESTFLIQLYDLKYPHKVVFLF